MLRSFLASCILICCVFIGLIWKKRLIDEANALAGLSQDLDDMLLMIKNERLDIESVKNRLVKNGKLPFVWQDALGGKQKRERILAEVGIENDIMEELCRFLDELGKNDMETEVLNADRMKMELQKRMLTKNRSLEEKAKLAGALPLLIGLALAIILV